MTRRSRTSSSVERRLADLEATFLTSDPDPEFGPSTLSAEERDLLDKVFGSDHPEIEMDWEAVDPIDVPPPE